MSKQKIRPSTPIVLLLFSVHMTTINQSALVKNVCRFEEASSFLVEFLLREAFSGEQNYPNTDFELDLD